MRNGVSGADRAALRATVAARYAAGASIKELAAGSGWSYGFVHKLLCEAGVPLRRRGPRNKRKAAQTVMAL